MYIEVHDALGAATIKECFLVNIEFRNESLFDKALY